MTSLRAFLFHAIAPRLTAAEIASYVFSATGILGLVIGIIIMPSLGLSEAGFYLALLALIAFMCIAYSAGQLTLIADELKRTRATRET